MSKALTIKQNQFIQGYLTTGNATEAAYRAYKPKNRNVAHAIGAENLQKPTIRRFIKDVMEENGLTTALVIKSLVEDIKSKPGNRTNELLLASKILGLSDGVRREDITSKPPVLVVTPQGAKKYNIKYTDSEEMNKMAENGGF